MRPRCCLALTLAATALLPLAAHAQGGNSVLGEFRYSDPNNGDGVMVITKLSTESTRFTFQPIRVTLALNNGARLEGNGVHHSIGDDGPDLPPFILVAFTLVNSQGRAFFFQGNLAYVNGLAGDGTYYRVDTPQIVNKWSISNATNPGEDFEGLNSAPVLNAGWDRLASSDALGGALHRTFNNNPGIESTATWSGNLTNGPGTYQIEVFIPRVTTGERAPRTNSARYVVTGAVGPFTTVVNQSASFGWVSLGRLQFSGSQYQIQLVDETGERDGTRALVANAVRVKR